MHHFKEKLSNFALQRFDADTTDNSTDVHMEIELFPECLAES